MEPRDLLLSGIKRVAGNMGCVAGLLEDNLPHVIVLEESVPLSISAAELARWLRNIWVDTFGEDSLAIVQN